MSFLEFEIALNNVFVDRADALKLYAHDRFRSDLVEIIALQYSNQLHAYKWKEGYKDMTINKDEKPIFRKFQFKDDTDH